MWVWLKCVDPSLADLVDRILPVSLYYMSADAFVQLHSQFEYGLVSHALCAAIRGLLKVMDGVRMYTSIICFVHCFPTLMMRLKLLFQPSGISDLDRAA